MYYIDKKRQLALVRSVRRFYERSIRELDAGNSQTLRSLYEDMCQRLAKKMPVKQVFSPEFNPEQFKKFDTIIVVANHIQTPFLAEIGNPNVMTMLKVRPHQLPFKVVQPLILRHYPIVNFLREHGYTSHVVGGNRQGYLQRFSRHWQGILIPDPGKPNRFRNLTNAIHKLSKGNHAVVMFPSGRDMQGFLPALEKNEYTLHSFKRGFAVLAALLNLPVLPISLTFDTKKFSYKMYVHPLQKVKQNPYNEYKNDAKKMRQLIASGIEKLSPKAKITLLDY